MSGAWTPPKTYTQFVNLTKAEMDTYQRDNLNYLKTHIALEAANAKTISGGVITITQAYHKIAGEGAADDELVTISGGAEGVVIILRPNGNIITLKDGVGNLILGGDIVLATDGDHIALICDDAGDWRPLWRTITRVFMVNAFQYPATATEWAPTITGAYMAASIAAKKCWLPLNFLKIGDAIVDYKLTGDMIEAAAVTLDCKLVRVNLVDPLTTTDVAGGDIAQVDADGDFDSLATLTAAEVVATDKQYLLELLGTTGIGDSIYVMGAEVTIRRLI